MIKKVIALLLIFSFMTVVSGCSSEKKVSDTVYAMNTVMTVTVYGKNPQKALDAAKNEIRRIEFLLSSHIEDTEIWKVNQGAAKSPVKVSDETADVITSALEVCRKTDGAFDITIKPLADLWNITAENPVVPSEEAINAARALVDYRGVEVKDGYVTFDREGMSIDLGGAAKGYCADKVVQVLKKHGIKNAILDLGGNVYAMGKSESNRAWNIGLQDPSGERGSHFKTVQLSDATCVTSGSYERYFEQDGKVYHHIIDPKTGYPSERDLISVSVVGNSSFEADMLSTAIFVMGYEGFEKIKSGFNYDKYIIVNKSNTHLEFKR